MDVTFLESILSSIVRSGTPLLLIGTGILVSEKSGILNLGQEGMATVGACTAFSVVAMTGSHTLGTLAGLWAGCAMALLFALVVIVCKANQVASGLALTILGLGAAALAGDGLVGITISPLAPVNIPGLAKIPLVGPMLFQQDLFVYGSWILAACIGLVMHRTQIGTIVSAVGHDPIVAHQFGYNVAWIRAGAIALGGICAGLGGSYLALSYTPIWSEGIVGGRGWIALALVVFASWRMGRLLVGALVFGSASIVQMVLQTTGVEISPQLLGVLPYAVTILALVMMGNTQLKTHLRAPQSLGINH